MGGPELFDVIIVAARGAGPAAAAQLVQSVARRFGMSPGTVALGLDRGGIEIHRGLVKSEAIAATRALHELGAVAEVRAARDASGILMIEPDAEAAPSEPGDVPAAPPFGVLPSVAPRIEPVVERSREPVLDARREPVVERSREPALDARREPVVDARREPVLERSRDAVERSRGPAIEPPRAQSPTVTPPRTQPPAVTPPRAQPRPRAAATPNEGAAPAGRRAAAASGVPLDADAPAISREALGDAAPVVSRFVPPGVHERVELDLAAAGLAHAPVGTSAVARGRSEAIPSAPPPPAPETSATSGRFPSESMRAPASMRAPTPAFDDMPKPGLLAGDRVLSILIAACLGAVLGLIVAFGWVRGDSARACERLEGELQASVADPIAVEEGRARTPDAIARELADALEDERGRFFMVWALVALPITAAGAIPRPQR